MSSEQVAWKTPGGLYPNDYDKECAAGSAARGGVRAYTLYHTVCRHMIEARQQVDSLLTALRDKDAALAAADAKCDARVTELKREYDGLLERERKVAHELKAERDAARDANAWISVGERLPEPLRDVMASSIDGNVITAASCGDGTWFTREGAEWGECFTVPVTHWRPLPAPPSVPAKEGE